MDVKKQKKILLSIKKLLGKKEIKNAEKISETIEENNNSLGYNLDFYKKYQDKLTKIDNPNKDGIITAFGYHYIWDLGTSLIWIKRHDSELWENIFIKKTGSDFSYSSHGTDINGIIEKETETYYDALINIKELSTEEINSILQFIKDDKEALSSFNYYLKFIKEKPYDNTISDIHRI